MSRDVVIAALVACALGGAGCDRDPGPDGGTRTREISVYFLRDAPCEVHPVPRVVTGEGALDRVRAALELLLAGPTEEERASGYRSAIPDSVQAWRHWQSHVAFGYDPPHEGGAVRIRDIRPQGERLLLVDFSGELEAFSGGADGACAILRQIESTVSQFEEYDGALIAVEGRTGGILQP